jgi:hypothetical protein
LHLRALLVDCSFAHDSPTVEGSTAADELFDQVAVLEPLDRVPKAVVCHV